MCAEAVERVPISFRSRPLPRPICCKLPGLTLVTQANIETFPESLSGTYRDNRGYELNTLGQISKHPVSGADKEGAIGRIGFALRKVKNPRVFEKTPDNRPDADVFRPSADARPKARETTNDQIDWHARR